MQVRQENKRAIREFECVVMHLWYVLVDLSKDRRPGAYCSRLPAIDTGRTYHLRGKGELRSGKNADRRCGILRRGKPTCTGVEVAGRKLVTALCGACFAVCKTEGTHGRGTPLLRAPHQPNPCSKKRANKPARTAGNKGPTSRKRGSNAPYRVR